MSISKERRIGKTIVSGVFVHEHTDILADVFAKIKAVVLQLDHHYDSDMFEYTLYSPFFEICNKGEYAPKYELVITNHFDEKGILTNFDVEAKKLAWDYTKPYNSTIKEWMLEQHS